MTHLDLTKGARYRVLCSDAKRSRIVPCSFAFMGESRPLAPGEVITYKEFRLG